MRKRESKQIGEFKYEVSQLGAVQGRKVLTRLIRAVGPAFKAGGDGQAIIAGIAENLAEDDVEYLCDAFAPMTHVQGGGKLVPLNEIFDAHFAGNYLDMMKWLAFCLELNFASFFRGLLTNAGALGAAAASDSSSPSSLTGTSGVS